MENRKGKDTVKLVLAWLAVLVVFARDQILRQLRQHAGPTPPGVSGDDLHALLATLGKVGRDLIEQLAELVHLHPAYFSTLFHKATGLPPSQYLARHRLRRAREMLLSTNDSIREIATATGYRDPFYLSRAFRRAVGVSPSEYRKTRVSADLP